MRIATPSNRHRLHDGKGPSSKMRPYVRCSRVNVRLLGRTPKRLTYAVTTSQKEACAATLTVRRSEVRMGVRGVSSTLEFEGTRLVRLKRGRMVKVHVVASPGYRVRSARLKHIVEAGERKR